MYGLILVLPKSISFTAESKDVVFLIRAICSRCLNVRTLSLSLSIFRLLLCFSKHSRVRVADHTAGVDTGITRRLATLDTKYTTDVNACQVT
jgi:hypothetical protein